MQGSVSIEYTCLRPESNGRSINTVIINESVIIKFTAGARVAGSSNDGMGNGIATAASTLDHMYFAQWWNTPHLVRYVGNVHQ